MDALKLLGRLRDEILTPPYDTIYEYVMASLTLARAQWQILRQKEE